MIGRGWPQPFGLLRREDPSRVSGTGLVASGVIWPDSRVAMQWCPEQPPAGYHSPVRQVNLWDSVEEIEGVHAHGGLTRLETRDPASPCVDLGLSVFGVLAQYRLRARVTHWGVRWDSGTAVTWRADETRPTRVETWPDWATAAFGELADPDAGEVQLAWVPSDALTIASAAASLEGRRWRTPRGKTAAHKISPR